MLTRHAILACLLVAFAIGGCDQSTTVLPTEPPPAGDAPGNNSTVTARSMGVCPATGPCVADFAVTLFDGDEVAWVFAGATPPTSPVQAGSVSWPTPGAKSWSSNVCNPAAQCTGAQNVVNFVNSVSAASTAGSSVEMIGQVTR